MTDLIYNHITARIPGTEHLLINLYGLLYKEITASSLVKIDVEGNIIWKPDTDYGINKSGYVIHGAIHKARPDVKCVLHTHTRAGMAVAAMTCGLLPLSQTSIRFVGHIGYHDYEGPAVDLDERERLVRDLGPHDAMIMRNHGLLTCGATIQQAFNTMYQLELSCRSQVDAMAARTELTMPGENVLAHTAHLYQPGTRRPYGVLEWPAMLRLLDAEEKTLAAIRRTSTELSSVANESRGDTMTNARVTGLRSVELGVPDLEKSADFYRDVWGLEDVLSTGDTIHMRGTGAEHHVLTLRQRPKARFLGVHFAAADHAAVNRCTPRRRPMGRASTASPPRCRATTAAATASRCARPRASRSSSPPTSTACPTGGADRSRPTKLTHVVLNASRTDDERAFFIDALGFRLSELDRHDGVRALHLRSPQPRAGAHRGPVAQPHGLRDAQHGRPDARRRPASSSTATTSNGASAATGRATTCSPISSSPTASSPNTPPRSTRSTRRPTSPQTPEYWRNFPGRPCRWGMAGHPSNRLKVAMAGGMLAGSEEGERCEQVMAKTLGR